MTAPACAAVLHLTCDGQAKAAFSACLATEHAPETSANGLVWRFSEPRASDLRAVLNTALRSLVAADEVIHRPPRS